MSIKLRSIKPVEIIGFLILMFTISTLFQGVIPFSLNRVIISMIFIVIISTNIPYLKKKTVLLYGYIFVLFIFNVSISTETGLAIKDLIYFGTTLCILDYFSPNKIDELSEEFNNDYLAIKNVLYVVYFVTIMSLFIPANYNSAWGDGTYFIGFARDTHVMASSSCLLMALFLFIYSKERYSNFRAIILISILFIIFETGARTYIVPACIILYLYVKGNLKSQRKRLVIFALAIVGVTYIFLRSGMYEKFIWSSVASNQYASSNLVSSTGGRSAFWLIDIKEYLRINPIFQLIGRGFDYVYQVNYKYYHMHIWAHNDFIDLLLSTGIIGTIFYIRKWITFTSCIKRAGKLMYIGYIIYILFPMFFNGMFTTQHYFLSVIILTMILREKQNILLKGQG